MLFFCWKVVFVGKFAHKSLLNVQRGSASFRMRPCDGMDRYGSSTVHLMADTTDVNGLEISYALFGRLR